MNALVKLYTWGEDGKLAFVENLCDTTLEYVPLPRDEITLRVQGLPHKYICCGRHWRDDKVPQLVELMVIDPADTATFRTLR
jgi:hypothetical protein